MNSLRISVLLPVNDEELAELHRRYAESKTESRFQAQETFEEWLAVELATRIRLDLARKLHPEEWGKR